MGVSNLNNLLIQTNILQKDYKKIKNDYLIIIDCYSIMFKIMYSSPTIEDMIFNMVLYFKYLKEKNPIKIYVDFGFINIKKDLREKRRKRNEKSLEEVVSIGNNFCTKLYNVYENTMSIEDYIEYFIKKLKNKRKTINSQDLSMTFNLNLKFKESLNTRFFEIIRGILSTIFEKDFVLCENVDAEFKMVKDNFVTKSCFITNDGDAVLLLLYKLKYKDQIVKLSMGMNNKNYSISYKKYLKPLSLAILITKGNDYIPGIKYIDITEKNIKIIETDKEDYKSDKPNIVLIEAYLILFSILIKKTIYPKKDYKKEDIELYLNQCKSYLDTDMSFYNDFKCISIDYNNLYYYLLEYLENNLINFSFINFDYNDLEETTDKENFDIAFDENYQEIYQNKYKFCFKNKTKYINNNLISYFNIK